MLFPRDLLRKMGAIMFQPKTNLKLGKGRSGLRRRDDDRRPRRRDLGRPIRPWKIVLGASSLEDLSLNVEPVKGRLEATRPPGVAYY